MPERSRAKDGRPTLREMAIAAMEDAVRGVIEDHRRRGQPLAVWDGRKVVHISAEQAAAEWKEGTQCGTKEPS
ncbi:MAG: hypothetical protein JXR37_20810 [Kiritimatiellae bacterium]|nr:hypothetical protein [Kiritimatiellia bacterium]